MTYLYVIQTVALLPNVACADACCKTQRSIRPAPFGRLSPRITYAIYQAAYNRKHPDDFSVFRARIDPKNGRHIAARARAYPYSINGTDIFNLSPNGSKLVVSINRVDPRAWITPANRNDERYADHGSDLNDLAVLNLTSGVWKRLTQDNAGYTDVVWSSDSKSIAYVSARGVDLRWPPEPRKSEWCVYVQNVQTGSRHMVFKELYVNKNNLRPDSRLLRWLPDSHRLLYISDDPAGLFLLDTQGSKPVLLSEHIPNLIMVAKRRIAWVDNKSSADNKTFLSATLHTMLLPSDLSTIKLAERWNVLSGMKTFLLPTAVVEIVVSPDGSRLAFTQIDRANKLLTPVVIDLNNLSVARLGSVVFVPGGLSWSQNGNFLLHLESQYDNPGKRNMVIAIPATGGKWQTLANVDWKQPVAPLKTTVVLDLPEAGNVPFVWQEAK